MSTSNLYNFYTIFPKIHNKTGDLSPLFSTNPLIVSIFLT